MGNNVPLQKLEMKFCLCKSPQICQNSQIEEKRGEGGGEERRGEKKKGKQRRKGSKWIWKRKI